MRFFSLLDFQYVVLSVFLGLIILVLMYVAFGVDVFSPRRKERQRQVEEYPGGIQTEKNPIPLLLIFIYVGFAVWALVYVIFIGVRGGPF